MARKNPRSNARSKAVKATHVVLAGSRRPALATAQRLGDSDPKEQMEVTLTLRGPKLPALEQSQAKSMSHELLESTYGARPEDVTAVERVLKPFGLKVEGVSLAGRSIRVSGRVAAMEAAFQQKLGVYHCVEQGDFRGRAGTIKIPAELAGIVTGVFGLDERRVARRKAPNAGAEVAAIAKLRPLTPMELEARYNFPPGDGTGQQIAIAEFQGGYIPEDLSLFCTKQNRPEPKVTMVPVGLSPLTLDEMRLLPKDQRQEELSATSEVMMDVEIVAGLCPKADVFVYFAPFSQKGWVDLLNQVISGVPAKPVTLSISWGLTEDSDSWSKAARAEINDRLKALAVLGITVCISSGDDGSGDELSDGRAHVDFPSSSSFTLSVGGTMLTGGTQSPIEETWWESPGRRTGKGGGSTGGGVSIFFPRPPWQAVKVKSLNAGSIDGRVMPDVAALAGPPFYDLKFLGKPFPGGGTSASAPLWAALIARIDAALPPSLRKRFLPPLLYQKGANGKPRGETGCQDVTVGQNASLPQPGVGYQAKKGFDAVTGWGTPDGTALLRALS